MKARIIKSARRVFDCLSMDTQVTVQATAKGNLLKDGELVVGDYVTLEKEGDEYFIAALEPRENTIFRRIIRENAIKVMAANLDLMVVVCSVAKPNYKRGLIDRYLMRAAQWDLPVCVVFNKIDLHDGLNLDFEKERLSRLELLFFETCAKDADSLQEFKEFLRAKTSIFIGQSGVGKSKLISALTDGHITLESRGLAKVGKGAHTTTWTELVHYGEFQFIDSPGVRTMSIEDISQEELPSLFPDLEPIFIQCQFRDCQHLPHTKGCAFYQGANENDEGLHTRLESFLRFKEEISAIPDWQKS